MTRDQVGGLLYGWNHVGLFSDSTALLCPDKPGIMFSLRGYNVLCVVLLLTRARTSRLIAILFYQGFSCIPIIHAGIRVVFSDKPRAPCWNVKSLFSQ